MMNETIRDMLIVFGMLAFGMILSLNSAEGIDLIDVSNELTLFVNETADLSIQIYNQTTGLEVTNAVCNSTIFYPNKTTWHEGITLSYLSNGIYYNNSYLIPETTGTYLMTVNCSGITQHTSYASFKVDEEYDSDFNSLYAFIAILGVAGMFIILSVMMGHLYVAPHAFKCASWILMLTGFIYASVEGIVSWDLTSGYIWVFIGLIFIELVFVIVDVFVGVTNMINNKKEKEGLD